ncbi:bifunctional 2-polyprenyl-6-hydroxyphenol methylase/3-demethylubiquinol 3-O-methyltransferase UbiG [Cupriavidus sp. AU9028]|uniref:class I SAM-dependent methyltransferase n=1 Tax=Cupriavidus sp. AU9028 TaxID=2871157 RepID=UPI001C95670D|nr:class I SAM-dependent methyltransferase [Cupriavidus sp. AU9028]MBY4895849.1 class I SAM-dependent methyltransferase [Cupriavidus sp. AU9028]
MTAPVPGSAGYDTHASLLAQRYEALRFEDVHRHVLHLIPPQPCMAADIGAGSGRDAAALAARGHTVVAVEPTAALRAEGQRLHAGMPIEWTDDSLPALNRLREAARRFDLMLLSAVWMHLDEGERAEGMASLAELLAPGGVAILSLRHGPVPEGRRMFDVSAEETLVLGGRHGLQPCHRGTRQDMMGRPDVHWSLVGLRKPQ